MTALSINQIAQKHGVTRKKIERVMRDLGINKSTTQGVKTVVESEEYELIKTVLDSPKTSNMISQVKTIYEILESFTSADNVTLEDIQKRQNFLERLPDLIELHQALLEQQKIRLQLLGE